MDAIAKFAAHVVETSIDDMPDSALVAAETLILDTVGVGIGGSAGPMAADLAATQAIGGAGDAHVWSIGARLPAPTAAMCNAYQIHNGEFDCVHEAAVAHVLSAIVPAAFACAERNGAVSGKQLVEAAVLGVDVAVNLGVAATSGLRFFRPATVGAFGASAAMGKLMGFDTDRMVNAFSMAYGQLCGTMQAHEEGSMLLAMQMGFNARNAVTACDLAAAGFDGPKNILEGRFGYFGLIESEGDIQAAASTLGKAWRIEEIAHKPFPSGRATHGVLDGCLELQRTYDIDADQIGTISATVPPLVQQLVGRPYRREMALNYARLCAAYVAARALISGPITLQDFQPSAYQEARTQRLAELITISAQDDGNPNALTPVEVTMTLKDGTVYRHKVEAVYGCPQNPMGRPAQLEKFHTNCAAAAHPVRKAQADELIERLTALRHESDVALLIPLMIGQPAE
jgi:aconitate decarboxylase